MAAAAVARGAACSDVPDPVGEGPAVVKGIMPSDMVLAPVNAGVVVEALGSSDELSGLRTLVFCVSESCIRGLRRLGNCDVRVWSDYRVGRAGGSNKCRFVVRSTLGHKYGT
jgi:hypothetical protein